MLTTGLGNENIFCALIDNFHLLCDVLTSNQEEVLNASTESELGKLKNKIALTSFLAGVEARNTCETFDYRGTHQLPEDDFHSHELWMREFLISTNIKRLFSPVREGISWFRICSGKLEGKIYGTKIISKYLHPPGTDWTLCAAAATCLLSDELVQQQTKKKSAGKQESL